MAKKFNLSKNNTYNNREVIKNNLNSLIVKNDYETKINYFDLGVTEEEKEQLVNYEQVIIKKQEVISISLMEISTALYSAQNILSQRKEGGDGTFLRWCEQLNLSRAFVYRCLDKYKLFLISNMEAVMDLTVRETSMITKALKNNYIEEAEVVDIIKSNNIAKCLDEKINGNGLETTKIDMGNFSKSTKEEQINEIKKLKKDIKSMNEDLSYKKEKLKELKLEVEDLKEKIKIMKEIQKSMELEFVK